jgi:hypothetical protein
VVGGGQSDADRNNIFSIDYNGKTTITNLNSSAVVTSSGSLDAVPAHTVAILLVKVGSLNTTICFYNADPGSSNQYYLNGTNFTITREENEDGTLQYSASDSVSI